jgi:FlaA1/EpsC-like NDP-sugar epimerase
MIGQIMPLITLDTLSVVASFWLAMAFRFDGAIAAVELQWLVLSLPVVVVTYLVMNSIFGLYRYLWRYASADAVLAINASAASSTLLLFGWTMLWRAERPIPLSVVVVGGIFSAALFTVVRYRQRLLTGLMGRVSQITGRPDRQRVLVIGAGDAGQMLARQIQSWGSERAYELVGFVDDNPAKHGQRIHDVEVLGACTSIPQIVAERNVGLVIIAIHKLEGAILRDMLSLCLATSARVKILPDFLGSIEQAHNVLPLRDIHAEDLLGRELTEVDKQACSAMIAGSTVLVTGGAGSIGSELCRQIMALRPRLLLMVDNNETGLHDLFISLQCPDGTQVVPIVADVTNYARMESIIARYRPKAVFHAAAYKHVPMMEHHPSEAVRVNILGTLNLSDLAAQYGVERFVFVSTDKAVNPSSVMGATKRVGELLIMANAERARTSVGRSMFTAVRFGNVLGSRGSVVPTFVKQIERGGPVTITHPEMTRFFISISEAVSLVIQAATMTDGGDIFMLDMGQPIRIEDLAHKMIRLRGLRPHADIPITYTGVRPGEKLCEELTSSDEQRLATIHPKLFQIHSSSMADSAWLYERITELVNLALDQQTEQLTALLWQLVRADTAPWPLDVREVGEPLHSHIVGETLAYRSAE